MSPQKDEARVVVERIAKERGSRLVMVGRDFHFAARTHSLDRQTLIVWKAENRRWSINTLKTDGDQEWKPVQLTIPLLGYHQVENAATAYTALQVARQEGLTLTEAAIQTGMSSVRWPGRFEILQRKPDADRRFGP